MGWLLFGFPLHHKVELLLTKSPEPKLGVPLASGTRLWTNTQSLR